jgi:hypothetical protein
MESYLLLKQAGPLGSKGLKVMHFEREISLTIISMCHMRHTMHKRNVWT